MCIFSFEDGLSALQTAATNGHHKVVGLLLQRGANCGSNPLLSAACEGHVEVVRILLERGANVHAQLKVIQADAISSYVMISFVDQDHSTALHVACEKGHLDVVRHLLDHGANINAQIKVFNAYVTFSLNSASFEVLCFYLGRLLG
jgi:ankyrin repeat protein